MQLRKLQRNCVAEAYGTHVRPVSRTEKIAVLAKQQWANTAAETNVSF